MPSYSMDAVGEQRRGRIREPWRESVDKAVLYKKKLRISNKSNPKTDGNEGSVQRRRMVQANYVVNHLMSTT